MRTKRWLILVGVIAAIVGLTLAVVACGDDEEDGGGVTPTATAEEGIPTEPTVEEEGTPQATTVDVNLTEWIVAPDPDAVAAGTITFNASNIGGENHELMVIKTDLAPEALPTSADGSVDEAGAGIEVLGEIEEFAAGGEESLTLDLDAGAYVLICNVISDTTSHYAEGMSSSFTVTE